MKPPRRRSRALVSQQKVFFAFLILRVTDFFLKGTENFFAGFCS
jgi:hypothetical protein